MPDLTDLLDGAAPDGDRPAPVDRIVARGRRRRTAARAAMVAGPLAVAGIAVAAVSVLGGPASPIIDGPPAADQPSASETPETDPSATADPADPADPADTGADTTEPSGAPDVDAGIQDGVLAVEDLAADLFVLVADGGSSTVQHHPAGGAAVEEFPLDGAPGRVGLVPDGRGGILWQPDDSEAGYGPILRTDGTQGPTTIDDGDATRLVGPHLSAGVLLERVTGSTIDDQTSDLVVHDTDTGEERTVAEEVGGWESGVSAAAATDHLAFFGTWVEAYEFATSVDAQGTATTVFEGGDLTGEHVHGVGITRGPDLGVVLVEDRLEGAATSRLLLADFALGEVTLEVDVPADLGLDADAVAVRDVTTAGRFVVVNRQVGDTWVAPLVYDVDADAWGLLHDARDEVVAGRAVLAP